MAERARIPHVPALDGVRGAAVAAVLVFHADHLSGGFLGVDLFFTLSGYLITALLIAEWRSSGTIALGRFWIRRARRLMPALLAVIAAVAVYAAVYSTPAELGRIRDDGLAALFYVANWHEIAAGRGYWDAFASRSPFEHMWSLAIEEQFYVFWPLLAFGLMKLGKGSTRWLGAFCAIAGLASAVTMIVLHTPGGETSRVYFGSDTRAAAILIGAGLAILLAERGHVSSARSRVLLELAGWASLLSLVAAWKFTSLASDRLYEGGFLAAGLGAAVVIAAIVHPQRGGLSKLLAIQPLRWLGLGSYGLYLWHWPIFVWLSKSRTGLDGWTLTAVRLSVSAAVAYASYHLIEQPIRHGALTKWRGALAVPVGFAGAAAALVLATVGAVPAPSTALIASGEEPPGIATGDTTSPTTAGTTTTLPAGSPTTTQAPGQGPINLFITGDSVGYTVAKGLTEVAAGEQVTVTSEARFGCGISRGDGPVRLRDQEVDDAADGAVCHQWPTRWADSLTASGATHAVLVLGAWDVADRKLDDTWVAPCEAGFDTWWRGEADEAIAVLGSTGAKVRVLNIPYLRSDVLGLTNDEQDERVDCLNTILIEAAGAAGVPVIDVAGLVCPDGSCPEKVDDVVLRPDGVHYDGEGGTTIARWLVAQLRAIDALEAPSQSTTTSAPSTTTTSSVAPTGTDPADPAAVQVLASSVLATGRTPTADDPLRVMTVGDSLMWDAQLGIEAALEATGVVEVELAAIQGMGVASLYPWRTEWPRLLEERNPELVLAHWGGWDVKLIDQVGADAYRAMLDEAIATLASTGADVVLIGLPPSQVGWGDVAQAVPRTINYYFVELIDRFPGIVSYVHPDPFIAPEGVPVLYLPGLGGAEERVRKADYDHYCPAGAARFGQAMVDLLSPAFSLPPVQEDWRLGRWVNDERFDIPAESCTLEPPPAEAPPVAETVPPTTVVAPPIPTE